VKEQRTFNGVVRNFSDNHADEMGEGDSDKIVCFSHGTVGVKSRQILYAGSHVFKGLLRQSYEAYLMQFRQSLGVQLPPSCSQTQVKATIITRPKGKTRYIVNMDQVLTELQKRQIPYELLDLNGMSFRQQVDFATVQCSIYVAAHGQALWLTHFLPETAGVVEILPYGFPYPYYANIAASHGMANYVQVLVDQPWRPASEDMKRAAQSLLRPDAAVNDTIIDNIDPILETILDLLEPTSYRRVVEYFVSEMGVSQVNAFLTAKVFSKNQPLLVNVTTVVDAIEAQYQRLLGSCSSLT
jgi:hypothetical protein